MGHKTVTGGQTETKTTFEGCAKSSSMSAFDCNLATCSLVSRNFESCSSSVSFLCAGAFCLCRCWCSSLALLPEEQTSQHGVTGASSEHAYH